MFKYYTSTAENTMSVQGNGIYFIFKKNKLQTGKETKDVYR
jgi:hypothetical protein